MTGNLWMTNKAGLAARIRLLEEGREQAQKEAAGAKARLTAMSERITALNTLLDQKVAYIENLQKEIEDLRDWGRSQTTVHEVDVKHVAKVHAENDELMALNKGLRELNERLREEVDAAHAGKRDAEDELKRAEVQAAVLRSDLRAMGEELERVKATNNRLHRVVRDFKLGEVVDVARSAPEKAAEWPSEAQGHPTYVEAEEAPQGLSPWPGGYLMVDSHNKGDFEDACAASLRRGWSPLGGVAVTFDPGRSSMVYAQAFEGLDCQPETGNEEVF